MTRSKSKIRSLFGRPTSIDVVVGAPGKIWIGHVDGTAESAE